MSIVVTTPTGHIGSRVTQLLVHAGVRPTLLVRDPAKLPDEVRAASDIRQGDLTDSKFVSEATAGAEALFWLIPTEYSSEDPMNDILRLGEYAAEAIQKNNIERTVFQSSGGAEDPNFSFITQLGKVEQMLNATGKHVTHLRPGNFYTNLLMNLEELRQGVLTTTVPLDIPVGWNDPRDIGDIAAARLLSKEWTGQHVHTIHGPEDLTFANIAAILSEATGRPIQATLISDEESLNGMLAAGFPKAGAQGLVDMARGMREGAGAEYMATSDIVTPTTLGAWAYANLRPALAG